MKLKLFRLLVSGGLMAILALSLWPPSVVTARSSATESRGGTAGEVTPGASSGSATQNQTNTTGSRKSRQPTSKSATKSGGDSSRSADDSSATQAATPKKRPPAPAFDRPPLRKSPNTSVASGSSPSSSPGSRGGSTSRPNSSAGQPVDSSRTTSRPDDQIGARSDPSGRQAPVLRRSPDSQSAGADTDDSADTSRQKPVLRRSSDPVPDNRNPVGRGAGPPDPDPATASNRGEDDVVRLESTLVNLPLLVSDRSGRFIPRLGKRDFLLWEDNVEQEIASFASEEVPFNVALVLDVSPSVQGSIEDIHDAAIEFVRQLRNQDRVMVLSFDRNIHLHCDLTNDRMRLEDAIRSSSTGSGTSVYEAVYDIVARRFRGVEGRKALILFSDGEDTTSRRVEYGDAVNTVSESDVLVYGLRYPGVNMGRPRYDPSGGQWPQIQLPWPLPLPIPWPQPRRRRGPFLPDPNSGGSSPQWQRRGGGGGDFMADITAAGGGPVYDAQTIGDIRGLAAKIAEELRHVYSVSYYPTNALSNGGFRQIRVRVRDRDDVAVRYRRGYQASRDPGTK